MLSVLGLMHYSTQSAYRKEIIIAWIIGVLAFCSVTSQGDRQLGRWLRITFPGAILCAQLNDVVVAWAMSSDETEESRTPVSEKETVKSRETRLPSHRARTLEGEGVGPG